MLAYLSRYTHRVAISNRRLIAADAKAVTFKVKDYRIEGPGRYKTMTLDAHEFIRRFLIHVLPKGFHRIRHYGLLASGTGATTSRSPASCSTCRGEIANAAAGRARRGAPTQSRRQPSLSLTRRPVPAAAAACTSSRSSSAAKRLGHRLAAPAIDPDRHVMTIAVEAQRNDDASSWSPAGLGDPLAIRRRRSCRAARSHSNRTIATCCDAVARQTQPGRRHHHFARRDQVPKSP